MKIELNIPEIAELNTNIRQLIDTLNDLAVVGINSVKSEQIAKTYFPRTKKFAIGEDIGASIGSLGCTAPAVEEKPKRQRKAKVEAQEQPDKGTGAEVTTYAVGEHGPASDPNGGFEVSQDLRDQIAESVSEPQLEQAPVIEAELEPATTYVLTDCTDLAKPLQTAGKIDEAKTWMKERGADRLKDLGPSHYGAFIAFAKGLLG